MSLEYIDGAKYRRAAKVAAVSHRFFTLLLVVTLILGSALFMMPILLMLNLSLKTGPEIASSSPWEIPKSPQWENYRYVLTHPMVSFARLFLNTAILSSLGTVGTVLSCSLVAFPFARMKFRGKDRLFGVLLATMMLPGAVTMIPSYQLWAALGWINTWYPLWVPHFFASAFFVFLLRQHMMSVPKELDEAAILDGANEFVVFWRVMLPNIGASIATVAVFTFVGIWRDFMGPLLIINDADKQTLEMGLRMFQTLSRTDWQYIMAGSMIATLPLIMIFLACQRYFVKGLALTGGK